MAQRQAWVRARAASLGMVYVVGLALAFSGLAAGLPFGTAAAAANDITDCTGAGSAGAGQQTLSNAMATGGTWTFTCSGAGAYTLSVPISTPNLAQALTLDVASGVEVTLDGGGTMQSPIFTVGSGASLTLDGNNGNGRQDLTLTGGGSQISGAATVVNEGNLTFDHVAFTANTSGPTEGPIVNAGTMTVSDSTFTNNKGDNGGAIDNALPPEVLGPTPTLTVSDSSFAGNSVFPAPPIADSGGAIYSAGSLTVTRSTFTGNSATATASSPFFNVLPDEGGAIYVTGPFGGPSTATRIVDSTFTQNSALDGGAIYAGTGTGNVSLAVYGSTFSRNLASVAGATSANVPSPSVLDLGGAIYSNASTFALSDSTLSQNTAGNTVTQGVYGQGGAIYVNAETQTATVDNATLDANTAYAAGDSLYVSALSPAPTVTFDNSILSDAAPTTSNCALPQIPTESSPTLQGGHNLQYGDTTCTSDATGWIDANPQLEPLGAYGGPTEGAPGSTSAMQTEALGAGSPAIGAADPTVCSLPPVGGVDERGQARPATACDIGAYQTEVKSVTLAANPSIVLVGATSTVGGAVYDETGQGLPGQTVTLSLPPGSGSLAQTTRTTGPGGAFATTYTAPATLPSPDPVTVTASVYSQVYGALTATTTIDVQALVPVLTSVTSTLTGLNSGPPDATLQLLGKNFESPGTSPGSVSFAQGGTHATVPLTAATETDGTATVQLPAQFVAGAVYLAVYNPALGASTNSLPFTVVLFTGGGGGGGGGSAPPPSTPACPALTLPAGSLAVSGTSQGSPAGIAPDQKAASCVYTLSGPAPAHPQQVTIPYESSVLGGLPETRLSVFRLRSNGIWTFLPTTVDGSANTVTADVPGPATLVVLADLQVFPDVPAGFWAKQAIDLTAGAALIDGYPPPFRGPFDPHGTITRAQAAKMIVVDAQLLPEPGPTPFTDVSASDWFEPYVAAAYRAGILAGGNSTTFSPNVPVTREAFAVMLARALKLTATAPLTFADTNQISAWARSGVAAAVSAGYLVGEPGNLFDPLSPMTRADAAQAMARVVQAQQP